MYKITINKRETLVFKELVIHMYTRYDNCACTLSFGIYDTFVGIRIRKGPYYPLLVEVDNEELGGGGVRGVLWIRLSRVKAGVARKTFLP